MKKKTSPRQKTQQDFSLGDFLDLGDHGRVSLDSSSHGKGENSDKKKYMYLYLPRPRRTKWFHMLYLIAPLNNGFSFRFFV